MTDMPAGWVVSSIGELCNLINGHAFKPQDWTEIGLPIVRIQNLNRLSSSFNYYDGMVAEKFLIDNGELLFAWSGTPGTSFGAHIWRGGKAVLNQHIFKIQFIDTMIDRSFFMHAINQTLDEQIAKAHGGVGLRHVTKGKFEATKIPLAPFAEQKRIVAKINSLTTATDRAVAALDRIPSLMGLYKQAVIDAAFAPFDLSVPLLALVDQNRGIPYGIVQTGKHQPDGVPTVRAGDIKNFHLLEDSLKRVSANIAAQYRRTILCGGEVLMAIRGSVGETCVVPRSMKGNNISREVALIPVSSDADAKFIMYFLKSRQAAAYIKSNIKGIAQSGINLRDLKELPSPNISVGEQRKTVERIELAFEWLGRISSDHAAAIKLLPKLDAAIVSKAFQGALVRQDPNDEPATRLLERIRAEKKAIGKETRAARGKPLFPKSEKRKLTMADLIEVLKSKGGWISATNAAQELGIGDGSTTDEIEDFYNNLRDRVLNGNIEVERRSNEDWLRLIQDKVG